MSKNILIIESDSDRIFIERVLEDINVNIKIENPICNINDYACLEGLSEKSLIRKLKLLKPYVDKEAENKEAIKIGILVDADEVGIEKQVALINKSVKEALDEKIDINIEDKWFYSSELEVSISCHILNVEGKGELETLLKTIKSADSTFADCLDTWRECLLEQKTEITDKYFDKFYLQIYQRYDCCTGKDKYQADENCNFFASLNKDIWDFKHPAMNPLKTYLSSFK